MKNQFNKSLQVAISFLTKRLQEDSVIWENFIWFQKITQGKIKKVGEDTSGGNRFDAIQRKISFYGYRDTLVAEVNLEGTQFTNSDETRPTFWKVVAVNYRKNFDGSRTFVDSEWVKVEVTDSVLQ